MGNRLSRRIPVIDDRGVLENKLLARGRAILGVDEVGRGCLAGPLYAGACILDYQRLRELPREVLVNLRDSKKLNALKRRRMVVAIREIALEAHLGMVTEREIEDLGISRANGLAILRAIRQCKSTYDIVLVDGRQRIDGISVEQQSVIKGDDLCYAIAAASILAKEARDEFMQQKAKTYPEYGFEAHVGYGTVLHRKMIEQYGICPLHRKNFEPIRSLLVRSTQSH
jgi:ribonuclease HII